MSSADLFAPNQPAAPLAERLRPKHIDEVIGQSHLLGEGKPLRLAFQSGKLHSMILWGPPGVGKTTLARLMASAFDAEFVPLSAVLSGVKDIREAIAQAEQTLQQSGRHTILFVDEVHRFNKSQQDAFLPFVEQGLVTFIGATTENPSFEVNNALLSRAQVYVLQSLSEDEMGQLFERAQQVGVARTSVRCGGAGAHHRLCGRRCAPPAQCAGTIADRRRGGQDRARSTPSFSMPRWRRSCAVSTRAARRSTTRFPRCTNRCAAPIPMRRCIGSCACWTAAPTRATWRGASCAWRGKTSAWPIRAPSSCATMPPPTYERLGSPEGELALAQAVLYLAVAAKSNAGYVAYNAARAFVSQDGSREVPLHLRNAPTKLMKQLDYGKDYRYAHDEAERLRGGRELFP